MAAEERGRAAAATAEARFRGELSSVQAQLQLLRAKQNRVMTAMGAVMGGGSGGGRDSSNFRDTTSRYDVGRGAG